MKSKHSVVPSLWALACAAALAQQTPAEPPPAQEEEKPTPNLPKIEVGWGDWGLRGNESTFRRYATIPRGLFFKELSYGVHDASPGMFGEFAFRGFPTEDYVLDATAIFGGRTSFQGSMDNAEFMRPGADLLDPSRRRTLEGSLRHSLNRNLDLVLDGSTVQLDKRVEGPAYNVHTRTSQLGARVSGDVGKGGRIDLSMVNRQFFDRANSQPDTNTQTWRGNLMHPFGALNLEGTYAHTVIDQDGREEAKVRHWRLDGDFPLNLDMDLQFGFRAQKYDLPQVENAYVRERFTSYARVAGNFFGMSGHLGYKRVETERVRDDQSYVDVPKFNTLDGRMSGRFRSGTRWTVKGSWQNLDGDAVMLTTDDRRLFWDDKANLQFKLDHGADAWGAYAAYNYGFYENQPRDIRVRTYGFLFGGTYQWRSNVDFFAEVSVDKADTEFTEPNATVGLDSFFPSSRVSTLGANWVIDPSTTLTTSFTEIVTDNDNPIFAMQGNVYSRFLSANVTHRTPDGQELGLLIAPGRYADRVFRSLGYEATVVMLTAKWRF